MGKIKDAMIDRMNNNPTLFTVPAEAKKAKVKIRPKQTTKHNTYVRKYYLHRKVKEAGFSLQLEKCSKTINVLPENIDEARINKYVIELQTKHSYGVQNINPMMQ